MKAILVILSSALVSTPLVAKPNVILIMADDLGYGDLSCYGSRYNRTPILDKLAAGGVRLTDYHSGNTVCTPSRMALLTGSYPPRVGWKGGVLGYKMQASGGLSEEARTIAEVFKAGGYRTGMCGKWHLGSAPERLPQGQGFDHAFYITMSNNQTTSLWRNGELVVDPFDNSRLTEEFTREAVEFIRADRKRPFFLYIPYTAPHFPVEAHPEWKGKSNNRDYGDVVEEMDARVGEILSALKELKIEDETIVIFTSDNGPQGGRKNKTVADPYRGGKWSSLEGGTRVPCIVSWPGSVPAGEVCEKLVASIDWVPTLAAACGLGLGAGDSPVPLDGVSVWPTLVGTGQEHARKDMLYWDGWATPHAIRVGHWKLFFSDVEDVEGSADGPVLFDLSKDFTEQTNLGKAHPDRVQEMLVLARERLADIAEKSLPLGGGAQKFSESRKPKWLK